MGGGHRLQGPSVQIPGTNQLVEKEQKRTHTSRKGAHLRLRLRPSHHLHTATAIHTFVFNI